MGTIDEKAMLLRYLNAAREALLWKVDGLSEYDARRPLTPTGTNLLGLVKHVSLVEHGYFSSFGEELSVDVPWDVHAMGPSGDMFATADQPIDVIIGFSRDVGSNVETLVQTLSLDAEGTVAWWPDDVNPVTVRHILVHMIAETHRHAGHADILRENLDGQVGLREDGTNMPDHGQAEWSALVDRIELAALDAAKGPS